MDIKEIGLRIKTARRSAGFTQKGLGKLIERTEPTIRKYESGEIEIPLSVLDRIATICGVHVLTLLGYTNLTPENIYTKQVIKAFSLLNDAGKKEALKRIKELTYVPEYKKTRGHGE